MGNTSLKSTYTNAYGYAGVWVDPSTQRVSDLVTSQTWATAKSNGVDLTVPTNNPNGYVAYCVPSGWVQQVVVSQQISPGTGVVLDMIDTSKNNVLVGLTFGRNSTEQMPSFQYNPQGNSLCITTVTFQSSGGFMIPQTGWNSTNIPSISTTVLPQGFNGVLLNPSQSWLYGVLQGSVADNNATYYSLIGKPAPTNTLPGSITSSPYLSTTSQQAPCNRIDVARLTGSGGAVSCTYSFYGLGSSAPLNVAMQNVTTAGDLTTSFVPPALASTSTGAFVTALTFWFVPCTSNASAAGLDSLLTGVTFNTQAAAASQAASGTAANNSSGSATHSHDVTGYIVLGLGVVLIVLLIAYFATSKSSR